MSLVPKSARVLGSRLDEVDWESIGTICRSYLDEPEYHYIVTLNGEIALKAQNNLLLQESINKASMVIPDSTNILWAGRRQGLHLREQTAGSDLIFLLCKIALEQDKTMFLLGSRGDTAARAGEILLKKFPGLKIVGSSNADPDDQYVIKQLQELRPDILVVAYGAPKQEIWMSTHQDLPIRLVAGLGGTLDMITGTLPRAPKFFRVVHFEWLWRLVLQPKRFKRIFQALLVFPYKVLTTKY